MNASAHPDFVDTMMSKVLRDLRFNLNQSLKSADDWYIGMLQNITKNSDVLDGFNPLKTKRICFM
jgi:hypothetical protein